ncbi:MAG: DUF5047 domain-containing protein [Nocardioidaceae bacterium]
MLPLSPATLAGLSGPVGVDAQAELSNDGGVTWLQVDLVAASVTADRTASIRYTASATLYGVSVGRGGVNVVTSRVRLWAGITPARGQVEWVPAGVYVAVHVEGDEGGTVGVELQGLERVLQDASFPAPRVIEADSAVNMTEALVAEALPRAAVAWNGVDPYQQIPRMVVEESRWEALSSGESEEGKTLGIAQALAGEAYVDARGVFTIAATPMIDDPPVWDVGRSSVLVDSASTEDADGLYNVVSAVGDKGDGSPTVGPVYAWDRDPASVTYAGKNPITDPSSEADVATDRDIRLRVLRYSSPLLTSVLQAEKAARSRLADSLGSQHAVSFTALSNPALEPGDVVRVEVSDGVWEPHLVDSMSFDLPGGNLSATTRTTTARLT